MNANKRSNSATAGMLDDDENHNDLDEEMEEALPEKKQPVECVVAVCENRHARFYGRQIIYPVIVCDTQAGRPTAERTLLFQCSQFEVGTACLRLSDLNVEISQFCDDQSYSKTMATFSKHEPSQLLFLPQGQAIVALAVVVCRLCTFMRTPAGCRCYASICREV